MSTPKNPGRKMSHANAQHSSLTGEWYTPPGEIAAVRYALGGSIDLDPCSCEKANRTVKARTWGTAADGMLGVVWGHSGTTAFVNPPGACDFDKSAGTYSVCGNKKRCSCGLPKKFLMKSILEAHAGMSIVYLAYSVNQLRQLSAIGVPESVRVSIALPADRIPYLDSETLEPVHGTNCDSAFVFLTPADKSHDTFNTAMASIGCTVYGRV